MLTADIFKWSRPDCSNGGISGQFEEVMVVNVDGPFGDYDTLSHLPRVKLVPGNLAGTVKAIPVQLMPDGGWEIDSPGGRGPMFGGAYIACSDSRFQRAVEDIAGSRQSGAVPLHDRFEA